MLIPMGRKSIEWTYGITFQLFIPILAGPIGMKLKMICIGANFMYVGGIVEKVRMDSTRS